MDAGMNRLAKLQHTFTAWRSFLSCLLKISKLSHHLIDSLLVPQGCLSFGKEEVAAMAWVTDLMSSTTGPEEWGSCKQEQMGKPDEADSCLVANVHRSSPTIPESGCRTQQF
jgi:hypothetical protein